MKFEMRIASTTKYMLILLIFLITTIFLLLNFYCNKYFQNHKYNFKSDRSYKDILYQINLGPRVPGSTAHSKTIEWISRTLNQNNWKTEIYSENINHINIKNIVGKKGNGIPWIIIGAHYDSRMIADHDVLKANQQLPVPGANDGASGVAILLEFSRLIDNNFLVQSWAKEIWLVFFDAEDNGDIPGWSWIMGSQSFADNLKENPDLVVILDMVGDADLIIYKEINSDNTYVNEIWTTASKLGYEKYFIPELRYKIIDDHMPFIQKGIPAVDIIDFDYPYWHTTSDTPDKVSGKSLSIVGNTILAWLLSPKYSSE